MQPDLPVTVIGGYLGAGKTTLLNRLLRSNDGRRIAVLVNDFGEINIDAALIENRDGRTIGLANGCVCCSIADDLGGALDSTAALSPAVDWVYIETSGVADPARVAAYAQTWPGYRLSGIWVLANVMRVRQQAADKYIGSTVKRQLGCAEVVGLSHMDLLPPGIHPASDVIPWLRTMAPNARIVPLDDELPLDALTADPAMSHSVTLNTPWHEHAIHAVTFERRAPIDLTRLKHALDNLEPEVVRAKGFVYGSETPDTALLLQLAGGTWTLEPAPASAEVPNQTMLVFHVSGGEAHETHLRATLNRL